MSATPQRHHYGMGLPDQSVVPDGGRRSNADEGRLQTLRAEIVGGIVAGLISVPASMGYAILAFAPLGAAIIPHAVRAGLLAVVVGCAVVVLLGGRTAFAYAPRSVVAFLISAVLLQSADEAQAWAAAAGGVHGMFLIMLLVVMLAGAFQTIFGALRIGRLVKYMPAPAIAGFQNAAAMLIFIAQIGALLGFREPVPLAAMSSRLAEAAPLTLLVGIATCVVSLKGAKYVRAISPTIVGLVAGTVLHYGLVAAGLGAHLGPVIGDVSASLPDFGTAIELARVAASPALVPLLPTLVGAALSVAVVGSLDAMLCARIIGAEARVRMDGNRELTRIGVANFVSPLLGGMAVGINLAASFAAQRAGARTTLSVAVHGLFVLACMLLLPPLIELMPRGVIAGMLMAVSIQLFDRWTLRLLRAVVRGEAAHRPRMLIDLGIVLVVAVVAIVFDLVLAVLLGMSVAIGFFMLRMSRAVVRRAYRGDQVRSRITRDPASGSLLASQGRCILVLELEGVLFFGTAERLAETIERELVADTRYLVLDLRRLQDVDSTGARVLLQAHDRFARDGRHVLLAGVQAGTALYSVLAEQGVLGSVTPERQFPDADRALEWAEDRLLLEALGRRATLPEYPLGQLDLMRDMAPNEISTMRSLLRLEQFRDGEVLFRAGEAGTDLYVVVSGRASATLELGGGRGLRLITFSAGTAFGELGLLDQEARSATITAEGELICYVLTRTDFIVLTRMYPGVAIKLLRNLARELSYRLRWANRTVFELDS